MFSIQSIVPTLRNLFALKNPEPEKRTTLRGLAPDPNVPREETWEDETPLPTITRDELLKLQGKNNR